MYDKSMTREVIAFETEVRRGKMSLAIIQAGEDNTSIILTP